MSERAFQYRIIAQDRVYLCMEFGFEGGDCLAKEAIREQDSGKAIPLMPWVRFVGDIIIEPIVLPTNELLNEMRRLRDLVQPTGQWFELSSALEQAQELARAEGNKAQALERAEGEEFYCDGHQELPKTTEIKFHDNVEPSSRLIWNDNTADELRHIEPIVLPTHELLSATHTDAVVQPTSEEWARAQETWNKAQALERAEELARQTG